MRLKMENKIIYLEGDLPKNLKFSKSIAVDTEATGLSMLRDRLCVVQLTDGKGTIYVVKVNPPYNCPNLKALLANPKIEKIFHFARFDVAMIKKCLGVDVNPIFCTKIASKLSRTSTDKHSLKALVKEMFDVDLNKDEQTSDWAVPHLSEKQIKYAAGDVEYLHRIKDILIEKLKRENRLEYAKDAFKFLPTRCALDLNGFGEDDLFAH